MEVKVTYGSGIDREGVEYFATSEAGINKAIDYVSSHGGGTVNIGEGIFLIDSPSGHGVIMKGNIRLRGVFRKTIFKPKPDSVSYKEFLHLVHYNLSPINMSIENIVFEGRNTDKIYGIAGTTSDTSHSGRKMIVKNCVFQKLHFGCYFLNFELAKVIDCYFFKCVKSSLTLSRGDDSLVEGCYLMNCAELSCLRVGSTLITNNLVSNTTGSGIFIGYTNLAQVSSNIIQNCASSGINVTGTTEDAIICGNIIQNCRFGMYLTQTKLTVHSNLVRGNRYEGIRISLIDNVAHRNISANLANKNGDSDLRLSKENMCIVHGNMFFSSASTDITFDSPFDVHRTIFSGILCNRIDEANVSKHTHYVCVNGRRMEGGSNNDRN